MPPAPRPPPAERSTAARNSAIASIVVITTRPRCRLPDLPTWYAIRRVAACQVFAAHRRQAGAPHPVRLPVGGARDDLRRIPALPERLLHPRPRHYGGGPPAPAAVREWP